MRKKRRQKNPFRFTTRSGRKVELNIWVRKGDLDRCAYAMDSLIRSMKWEEQVYGREYDLDVFNIVAVDDFNMGAMENKGLNVFNTRYVLADPDTATDMDYDGVEGVIAHEYFHNWSGNRVTCRDWFQLSLKEGLTVFRDQEFSQDMAGSAVALDWDPAEAPIVPAFARNVVRETFNDQHRSKIAILSRSRFRDLRAVPLCVRSLRITTHAKSWS
mgnify:CR=1 FL=1